MRLLTSILCLLIASGPIAAAETWRWVDKDGGVHYSDRPQDGAEKLQLESAPKPGSVTPANAGPPRGAPPKPFAYAGCEISSPNQDQVFQNVRSVGVSLNVLPSLQLDHTIVVRMNGGRIQDWPPTSSSYVLADLPRGSFSVTAQVLDSKGTPVCSSSPLTFHIRQVSMLTPGVKGAR
jgi:hypothetical protein